MWKFDRFASNIAIIEEHGLRLTYGELNAEGHALYTTTGGRCLVLQLCGNNLGSFLGYAGFLENGVVPAMLDSDMSREALESIYQAYQPKFLWVPEEYTHEGCFPIYSRFGYQLLQAPFGDTAQLHPDLALLLTTSGSTGSPKFVRQSYRNIRANTDSIVTYLSLSDKERPITTLPMSYTYGLSIINTHLDVGAAILLTNKSMAQKEFWTFFCREHATSFGGVPYTYEMLDRMRFTYMALPSLITMTQAGGKLLPALHEKLACWCAETGRQFIVMYGQCEATARMAYLPWEKSIEKSGSMGIAIPGGRFELIGAEGETITEPFVTGELRYYGDNVTMGYAESAADLSLGDERYGILDTGDMAQMDVEGYFTIVGRKKRFLKIFGNRINLDEAERLIKAAFPGTECACGGIDDQLYLFSEDGARLPAMKAFLSERTGIHSSAFRTHALSTLPKNAAGKTLYKELEPYYERC